MRNLNARRVCFLLALLVVFRPGTCRADQNDDWFEQANREYQRGDFKEALEIYRRILENGFESGPLYYNIGNCHYRLGHLGESILYYEKARRLIPEDEDLKANLAFTEAKTIDKITPLPSFWLLEGVEGVVFLLPRLLLWWLLIALYAGAVAAWIARILAEGEGVRVWSGRLALVLIVLGVFTAASLATRMFLSARREAVVLADTVKAFSEPGAGAVQVFILHEGTKVRLGQDSAGWVEIVLADGNVGWVRDDSLAEI